MQTDLLQEINRYNDNLVPLVLRLWDIAQKISGRGDLFICL